MSYSFDSEIEDDCLRFIREDSSHNHSDLFKSKQEPVKLEEQFHIEANPHSNMEAVDEEGPTSTKRRRSDNMGKSTSRKKVFYRDKMISLISEQEMQSKAEYNYGDYSQNARGKSPITREEQLRRNRESAKHSRQRRKEYVETLEEKNQENQKKIEELEARLKEVELQRDRLKDDNRSYMKTFLTAKNEAYQNLRQVLNKSNNQASEKLSQQLQILITKYGAAGSERIAATDFYMKQIIEILLADIHKYMVDCVVRDSGLFGVVEWSKLDDEICEILHITKEARVKLSRSYKFQMMQEFETFKAVSQKFYDAYRAVQNQARTIEKVFMRISLEFNDYHIAELLLWLEENKFSKELKKIRADWIRSVEEPEECTGVARKMVPSSGTY